MAHPSQEQVVEALASVVDPVFQRPMIELGTLHDVSVVEGRTAVKVILCSPADSVRKLAAGLSAGTS